MRWSIVAATLAAAVTSEGCALTEWLGLDDRFPQPEAAAPARAPDVKAGVHAASTAAPVESEGGKT